MATSSTPPSSPTTYDFIVVGAGASGCLLAARLASAPSRPSVLLFESGPNTLTPAGEALRASFDRFTTFITGTEVSFNYTTVPQSGCDDRELPYARGKGLGGSTLTNFAGWSIGSSADYDLWADLVGDDVWRWENVAALFRKFVALHPESAGDEVTKYVTPEERVHSGEGNLDVSYPWRAEVPADLHFEAAKEYGWKLNRDLNSGDPIGLGILPSSVYQGLRATSASAFLANPTANLTIRTAERVEKVLVEGTVAKGVLMVGGKQIQAEKEVILCAGALDTPKLLLLSGIGPRAELEKHDIPVVVDKPYIGKNLADHAFFAFTVLMVPGTKDRIDLMLAYGEQQAMRAKWATERLNCENPWLRYSATDVVGFLKIPDPSLALQELADEPLWAAHVQKSTVPHFETSLMAIFPVPGRQYTAGESIQTYCLVLHNMRSRGSVTLASSDAAVDPVIDLAILSHPYDQRIAVASLREMMAYAQTPVLASKTVEYLHAPKSDSDEDLLAFARANTGPAWHACGTVKMGKREDETACVDADFKVIGVQGLRVVDASVLPLLTNNHTQSVAMLVAQVAAEKMAREWQLGELPVRV